MTLSEAIAKADNYCPNKVDNKLKAEWISRLDKRIIEEILTRYPDIPKKTNFGGYDITSDSGASLVVSFPYDDIYVHYIAAEIYLLLHEQKHYNNEKILFDDILEDYKKYLNRNYRPGGVGSYRIR